MKILKIVLTIMIIIIAWLYIYRLGKTDGLKISQKNIDTIVSEATTLKCPYNVDGGIYKEFVKSANETKVVEKPVLIENPQIIKSKEPFDVKDFEKGLYKLSNDKGWDSRTFDINSDGIKETIINANIAMNHTPNIATIVSKGNIIFNTGGANVWISEVYENNGFLLTETLDWNNGEEKITRFIYKDDGFMPVWTQKVCWVKFN